MHESNTNLIFKVGPIRWPRFKISRIRAMKKLLELSRASLSLFLSRSCFGRRREAQLPWFARSRQSSRSESIHGHFSLVISPPAPAPARLLHSGTSSLLFLSLSSSRSIGRSVGPSSLDDCISNMLLCRLSTPLHAVFSWALCTFLWLFQSGPSLHYITV